MVSEKPEYIERPWGKHVVVFRGEGYLVKELIIKAGQKTSLQSHANRAESWTVIKGIAVAAIKRGNNFVTYDLIPGEVIEIEKGMIHQVGAKFADVIISEVWLNKTNLPDAEALREEDIQRY